MTGDQVFADATTTTCMAAKKKLSNAWVPFCGFEGASKQIWPSGQVNPLVSLVGEREESMYPEGRRVSGLIKAPQLCDRAIPFGRSAIVSAAWFSLGVDNIDSRQWAYR